MRLGALDVVLLVIYVVVVLATGFVLRRRISSGNDLGSPCTRWARCSPLVGDVRIGLAPDGWIANL
jgi:hypothetical protein